MDPGDADDLTLNKNQFLAKVSQSSEAVRNGDFIRAVQCYTEAINLDPQNHILYSNRSAAYIKLGEFKKGLTDATKARDINPQWTKVRSFLRLFFVIFDFF